MKISEMIGVLERYKTLYGDVECYSEQGDGRSTWAEPSTISVSHREIWRNHPAGKKYFVSV